MGLVVTPVEIDLTLYQGASWIEFFQWKYGETEETATGVDLTNAVVVAQVRENPSSDEVLTEASSADGTISKDASGNIEIRVVGADVAVGLDAAKGYRHVEVQWNDGDVCRLVQGRVTISKEVVKND